MKHLVIAAAVLAASPAHADALQDQLAARMRETDTAGIGFTQTTRAEQTGGKAREFVTRYDPRAAAANRWSVVAVDGHPPTDKERQEILKAARSNPVPSYARLARWFGAPATRVAQGAGTVTYRFAALPKGTVTIGKHDASTDTVADAVVNTAGAQPYVERVRFTLRQGFRIMLVAKVDGYAFTASYAPLPDGRIFPVGNDGDIRGSMMGKDGTIRTRTRYVVTR